MGEESDEHLQKECHFFGSGTIKQLKLLCNWQVQRIFSLNYS